MIVVCTDCGGLRVAWHTGSGHLIRKSVQLLIAERPSIYMAAWRWPFWHTERVRELGVVARLGSDLDRIFMTGSDLAHRPGLSALSSLTHHLHGLCPDFCAGVVHYRQDNVCGVHH